MSFGFKNARATYQRLVNKMFFNLLGMMEEYIDDMLVKSAQDVDHMAHLKDCFDIITNME